MNEEKRVEGTHKVYKESHELNDATTMKKNLVEVEERSESLCTSGPGRMGKDDG